MAEQILLIDSSLGGRRAVVVLHWPGSVTPGRLSIKLAGRRPEGVNMYKVWVQVYGETTWHTNGMTFDTRAEAEAYGSSLFARWTQVENWEVREV